MKLGDVVTVREGLNTSNSDCGEVVEIMHEDKAVAEAVTPHDRITVHHFDGMASGGCVRDYIVIAGSLEPEAEDSSQWFI